MNLFYVPEIVPETLEIQLSEEESKHACRVLRMKKGDQLTVLDGKGGTYLAQILEDHAKHCKLQIVSYTHEKKLEKEIHIAIAPTKNMDRIEWFLEKATELGITEITFVLCANSERKQLKEERLAKILIAAMKQSKRTYIPQLNPLIHFKEFIHHHPAGALAHCEDGSKKDLQSVFKFQNYPVLIGPEGDFSRNEIELAQKAGYDFVTLGENRLRTETAGLYACMQCLLIN